MRGLVIKQPWIDLIFDGKKTWEIRGSNTKIRGTIALIQSRSGKVIGTAELVDSIPLDLPSYQTNQMRHQIPLDRFEGLPYPKTHAWVLENAVRFDEPIPYTHPQGAVIWVDLKEVI